MLLLCFYGGLQSLFKGNISYLMRKVLALLTVSMDGWETKWGIIDAGPVWFLVALFIVREIFYLLQLCFRNSNTMYKDIIVLMLAIIVSMTAVLIHPYLHFIPFCILPALTALAFYAVGWYVHKYSFHWWAAIISVVCWPFAIIYGKVGLSSCTMEYYPLSFLGACGGTCVVYLLCKGLATLSVDHSLFHSLIGALAWCGMYSLPILCMHQLEMYSSVMYSLQCRIPYISYLMGWGEMVIAIILAYAVIHIPYLKYFYTSE